MFHQLSRIGVFETKLAFLHLEIFDLQEAFLSKLTEFSQGNNVILVPPSNIDGFI
jgi:hypothetical protein